VTPACKLGTETKNWTCDESPSEQGLPLPPHTHTSPLRSRAARSRPRRSRDRRSLFCPPLAAPWVLISLTPGLAPVIITGLQGVGSLRTIIVWPVCNWVQHWFLRWVAVWIGLGTLTDCPAATVDLFHSCLARWTKSPCKSIGT
jgi:hypothetical protein